jgi:hypothetical protein
VRLAEQAHHPCAWPESEILVPAFGVIHFVGNTRGSGKLTLNAFEAVPWRPLTPPITGSPVNVVVTGVVPE